jgi:hypothetical protein
MIRKWVAAILVLLALSAVSHVYARGGQDADDCPPHSKDPDCAGKK